MKNRTHRNCFLATAAVALSMSAPVLAQAQGGQGGGQNRTPEEQLQRITELVEPRLRRQLADAGLATDKQDAVINYWKAQQTARLAIRTKSRALTNGLRANGATDAQLTTLLNDLRTAVAQEKTRHEQALKDLDAQVNYSKQVRLEALLTVLGLIGEESNYSSIGGLGGFGGFGGGQGRGQGGGQGRGQGGRRGGNAGANN